MSVNKEIEKSVLDYCKAEANLYYYVDKHSEQQRKRHEL